MKRIMFITSVSFTCGMLIYALSTFIFPKFPPISRDILLQAFSVCATVALVMYGYEMVVGDDRLFSSIWIDVLIRIAIAYVCMFIYANVYQWPLPGWQMIAFLSQMIIPAFVITYFASYMTLAEYARAINESIGRRN